MCVVFNKKLGVCKCACGLISVCVWFAIREKKDPCSPLVSCVALLLHDQTTELVARAIHTETHAFHAGCLIARVWLARSVFVGFAARHKGPMLLAWQKRGKKKEKNTVFGERRQMTCSSSIARLLHLELPLLVAAY